MAWDTKYKLEFTDIYGENWTVEIQDNEAPSTVTELHGTGSPLRIDFLSQGNNIFKSVVNGSEALINVYSSDNFDLLFLIDSEYLTYRVLVSKGSDLFWQGFVNNDGYSEPYNYAPYPVTISCTDGLGFLKNFNFDLTGRKKASEIILYILAKISITEFNEYVNVFEDTMNDETSMFTQLEIDTRVFTQMDCYQILTETLKICNACIRQVNGDMVIYRKIDLNQTSISGRKITSESVTEIDDLVPAQYFHRGLMSNYTDGGTLGTQSPAKRIIVTQNYGNKESWLTNHMLTSESFRADRFDSWEQLNGDLARPVNQIIKGEKDGVMIVGHGGYLFYQEFGLGSIESTTDEFVIEFDYGFYNYYTQVWTGAVRFSLIQTIGLANYFFTENDDKLTGRWELPPTGTYIDISETNLPQGWSGWRTYRRSVTGIGTGKLTFFLYPSPTAVMYACYKDIRFYTTSLQTQARKVRKSFKERVREKDPSKLIFWGWGSKYKTVYYTEETEFITEQTFMKENNINGAEEEYNFILGDVINTVSPDPFFYSNNIDNILNQFVGSLSVNNVPTSSWYGKPLLRNTCDEIAHHFSSVKQVLSLPVIEKDPINIIGNFQDYLNKNNGKNRVFVFNSGEYDVRNRQWDIDIIEIASAEDIIPPDPEPPTLDAPVATDATIITTYSFQANWQEVEGAIRYYLDVSESYVFATYVDGYENLNVGNNLSYVVEGLDADTVYYYRVRAYDIWRQTSVNSNVISLQTLVAATYVLYTNTRFWFIPEADSWIVNVSNLSASVSFNNNFRFKLIGTADGSPVTYTAITANYEILPEDNENVYGEWDLEIPELFEWDDEYTLSVEYDSGTNDWIMLASKTYNS